MKKMTLLLAALLFLLGCAATLKDYKPKSTDEAAIKAFLLTYENAWNRRDIRGVLDLMHEKATLMTGGDRDIVSKKEYANILPKRIIEFHPAKLYEPIIRVKQDTAMVGVVQDMGRYHINFVYRLIRENGKWFIISSEY